MKRHIDFEKICGKQVFNILTEPDISNKKIVIMSHGFRGTSIGPARTFVDFEKHLLREDISTLRFDQPNGGNSEGDYIESSFDEWVKTTVYFAKEYLDKGYSVVLLGQSMGATTTMIASANDDLLGQIPCIILWVPDPKSTFNIDPNQTYEEGGQKYKGTFWQEAKEADFFGCLDKYKGGIHLVYGEDDKYISPELRKQVIDKVAEKGEQSMILEGQDHSSWDFEASQAVYKEHLDFIKRYI